MSRGIFRLKQVYEEQLSGTWSTRPDVWLTPSPFIGPVTQYDTAYFAGGYSISAGSRVSTVVRYDFSNDTADTVSVAQLPIDVNTSANQAVGNQSNGYTMGGLVSSGVADSRIYRIDYSNDTSAPAPGARTWNKMTGASGASNTNYGYLFGGRSNASSPFGPYSSIARFDFSSDTSPAPVHSNFTIARDRGAAVGNQTYAYYGGGADTPAVYSTVDRYDYANDTASATPKGPLSAAKYSTLVANGNANFGYFGGGRNPYAPVPFSESSTIDRYDYSNDTVTSPNTYNVSVNFQNSTGNTSAGYYMAGYILSPFAYYSSISRLDYDNDTNALVTKANVTSGAYVGFTFASKENDLASSKLFPASAVRENVAPQGTDFGYFGGGGPGSLSTVDRIDYSNDTATASVRGPLSLARFRLAATGNSSYGWFGGGNLAPGVVSTVDRIDYSNDSATASPKGPLNSARRELAATGNSSYGWFGGGNLAPGVVSTVDRIEYANDTATASVRGPLSLAREQLAATGNSSYGWFGGGKSVPGVYVSTVDRIEYANDTGTASPKGPLSLDRFRLAATGNASYGYFGGGNNPVVSTVDRIDYSNDTATASPKGPLSLARRNVAATGSSSFGYFGGGNPGTFSTVDRIDYSNDTATASPKGPLSAAKYALAASSSRANAIPLKGPGVLSLPVNLATGNIALSNVGYWYRTNINVDAVTAIDFSNDTSNIINRTSLGFPQDSPSPIGYSAIGNRGFGYFVDYASSGTAVRRINYSNDTASAIATRNLNAASNGFRAGVGNDVYGYFTNNTTSSLERIDYANDLVTNKGTLQYNGSQRAGTGNLNFGYIIGSSPTTSEIERIDYSNDEATSLIRGTLSVGIKRYGGACGNANFGYSIGGTPSSIKLTVDRIDYSNDTATTSPKGNLSIGRDNCAASGNADYGYVYGNGYSPSVTVTYFDRIDYSNDTAIASIRGTVANIPASPGSGTRCHAAIGPRDNALYSLTPNTGQLPSSLGFPVISQQTYPVTFFGYFAGGRTPSARSTVDRINYANDTGTASPKGSLSGTRYDLAATGNSDFGYFGGGQSPSVVSTVDRIDYSNDTATASLKGNLSLARYALAATGNASFGYFAGGLTPSEISTVDRIDYSNDTATASPKGPLSGARRRMAGTGNQNFGYFGGGYLNITTVDRIDYSNDTATASPKGPLSAGRRSIAATGNANFGYFGGGHPTSSTVDRVDYSNDTVAAPAKGPLSLARSQFAATGNKDFGYFGGGTPSPQKSTVDRVDYSNDTATAEVKGPLSEKRFALAAASAAANALPQ